MKYENTGKLSDEKFMKNFEGRVKAAIKEFKLFDKSKKLLVAASGGKDSTALLYLMKKFGYNVSAITVNAHIGCYSDENLSKLKEFCSAENIKLHEIKLRKEFGSSLCHMINLMKNKKINKTACSVCGTLRRYLLNKYARKLKADVLLTGHNLDDEAEGMMMAMFAGNPKQIARVGPLTVLNSFIKKAKPFYFVFEDEVEHYSKIKKFDVKYSWCPCSANASRRFYSELDLNSEVKFNLVKNMLDTVFKLKKHFKSDIKIKKCKNCREPSSNDVCQTCSILTAVKT